MMKIISEKIDEGVKESQNNRIKIVNELSRRGETRPLQAPCSNRVVFLWSGSASHRRGTGPLKVTSLVE